MVVCQKPDKISDLTQQKRERTTEDFLNLVSVYLSAGISYCHDKLLGSLKISTWLVC